MKDKIGVVAYLLEHYHDALIEFNKTYPRTVANSVIMQICDGCLEAYPPKLTDYTICEPQAGTKPIKVTFRIDRTTHPRLWRLYKKLPYGNKAAIIINIMNRHMQLAETEPSIFEKLCWAKDFGLDPEDYQDKADEQEGIALTNQDEISIKPIPTNPVLVNEDDTASDPVKTDPLLGVSVML